MKNSTWSLRAPLRHNRMSILLQFTLTHFFFQISIRGTLSLSDLMTDMVARPVGLKSKVWALFQNGQIDLTDAEQNNLNQLPDDIEVHSGMAEAAIYMLKEIKGKHLLEQAFVHFPDYPIVITGHSLGAGTAVILAFLLRLKYSNVRYVSNRLMVVTCNKGSHIGVIDVMLSVLLALC